MSAAPIMPPTREARFNVIARSGGFLRRINSLITGTVNHLTLDIEDLEGNVYHLRVTPLHGDVTMDPQRDSVYNIGSAMAVFVDENGNELMQYPPVNVSLNLNTEVTAASMPVGTLTMWPS